MDVDPASFCEGDEYGIGDGLSGGAVVEAGYGVALFEDGGGEFVDEVVAEDGAGFAVGGVAGASGRFEEFGGYGEFFEVFAMSSEGDVVGVGELVGGGAFAAVDFGPFVSDAAVIVAFHEGAPFPDSDGPGFEEADQAGPVINFGGRAGFAICGLISGGELCDSTAERADRSEEIVSEVDAVDGHIEEVTGPGEGLDLPPSPAGFGKIEEALAAEVSGYAEGP